MSRDKQIEEMAKMLCEDCARAVAPCSLNRTGRMCISVQEQAEALYNAGYRKIYDDHHKQVSCYTLGCKEGDKIAQQVAEEIFAEIEKLTTLSVYGGYELYLKDDIAELKKKYTEGGE